MIYEYECNNCGIFEAIQKITDPQLSECPKCRELNRDSDPPKRLISLTSFQLLGGGWSDDNYSRK